MGAIGRYRDALNYYYVTLRSSKTLSLRKLSNGVIHELRTATLPVTLGQWRKLRFEALGTRLRVYINGAVRLEATDDEHAEGVTGLADLGAQPQTSTISAPCRPDRRRFPYNPGPSWTRPTPPATSSAASTIVGKLPGAVAPRGDGPAYCIMLPPPNVTGTLHMGHAFQGTLMDTLTRWHRMRGDSAL